MTWRNQTMTARNGGLRVLNRMVWIGLFLAVSTVFAWAEWRSESGSAMGWFLATSLWSALCGIGYTVFDWWVGGRAGG